MLEQFNFLSNILFTSTDMFIKKTIFKKKVCFYFVDTYLINININLYFWIFIFLFCFDLVKFFSVTLNSDVLQRIVGLFLRGSLEASDLPPV